MEIVAASYLLTMSGPPIVGGAVVVHNGRIVATGPLAQVRSDYSAPVKDYPGCVLMPGLVNAHNHLELTHFPAWKIRKGLDYAPRTYVDWVIQLIKIKRGLSLGELELSFREGIRISLEAGTTTVGDILSDRRLLPLYADSPLGGMIYFELIGYDPVQCAEQLQLLSGLLDGFSSGSFRPGISPHTPHTVSESYFRNIQQFATERSLPIAVHAAESPDELTFLHDTTGPIAEKLFPFVHWEGYLPAPLRTTPIQFLDSVGALTPTTSLIHGVHVTASDVEILKKRNVGVVLCPRSNDRLVVGKPPAQLLKKAGVPLSLATDSLASNDSLSLWDEMRFFRRQQPGVFSPQEILSMVTSVPANALGLGDVVGSIESGKRADMIVVSLSHDASVGDVEEVLVEEGVVEEVFIRGGRV